MSNVTTVNTGSRVGSSLVDLLMADEIVPGSEPSYQICKTIYAFHPIGKKLVDAPITKAQSQDREISVPDSPEDMVRDQFLAIWKKIGADRHIRNTMRLARIYGISTLTLIEPDKKPTDPVDYKNLWKKLDRLAINELDPLNTSGSLVLNQDPNAPDFQKPTRVVVAGVPYNPGRCVVIENEAPLYIEYTASAFGYTGRSVYQRALLPLKSFVQSMITDDLVTIKAGVLIAKMKSPGSIIDNVMMAFNSMKRMIVKEARVGNVISVGADDDIVSLDLTNIPQALAGARKDILENIAVANDMPAILLLQETFAEGFGEGSEDAKAVAEYVDEFRKQMRPLYDWFDKLVQYLAWTPDFYKTVQKRFPEEWGKVSFEEAFVRWTNSFAAEWPSLLREPESELIKKDAVKLESVIAAVQVLLQVADPVNKAIAIQWLADNFNSLKLLFPNPLEIDPEVLLAYLEEQQEKAQEQHEKALEGPSPNRKFGDDAPLRVPTQIRSLAHLGKPGGPHRAHARNVVQ